MVPLSTRPAFFFVFGDDRSNDSVIITCVHEREKSAFDADYTLQTNGSVILFSVKPASCRSRGFGGQLRTSMASIYGSSQSEIYGAQG